MDALDLDVAWIHGVATGEADRGPAIQEHRVDERTWILRQRKVVHFEAPFLYLLCGDHRALLVDTGATADPALFPLRRTVDGILDQWLAEHPRASYGLVVAHSHSHGDHVAGDGHFGDTVYPGRLYVEDLPAFAASLDRLVAFAGSHPVTHVMGCHVEMTDRPGQDYPRGTTYQPDAAPLPMAVSQLAAVRDAAAEATSGGPPVVRDGFVVAPVVPVLQ